jgi:hypothetical protein
VSDKTDPRLAWTVLGAFSQIGYSPERIASDCDAADRAAGIVRVDTNSEALAKWLGHRHFPAPGGLPGYITIGTETARAVLAALREEAS